jgi:HAD superfamily hydrolase (TIGR01509 family)
MSGRFDLDGVLVDSEPISCRVTAAALTEAGIQLSETDVRERFLGTSTAAMLQEIEVEHRRRLPELFQERLRERLLNAFEHQLEPTAGVAAMLDSLPLARCVASSSHPDRIRRALELTGLLDRLAPHLFSATMVSEGKPAPDLFLLAATEMGADPARCLVIEDSEAGVRAGKAAAMTVFGFTGGSHLRFETHAPRLEAVGADDVFNDMMALIGLVEGVAA